MYAHQLKVVEQSQLKAIVKNAYFKGSYYLIEADLDGNKIFFENSKALKKDTITCLEILL